MEALVGIAAHVLELGGVLVVAGGTLIVTAVVLIRAKRVGSFETRYRELREGVGRAILLGLELLVGAVRRMRERSPGLERDLLVERRLA